MSQIISEFLTTFSHSVKQMTLNQWKEASLIQLKYVGS